MEKFFQVSSLNASYGNEQVLTDISFEIEKGQILGIVGESGSGKTTIFNSILGIKDQLRIQSGEIIFKDKDLLSMTNKEKRKVFGSEIGTVFQFSSSSLVPTRKIKNQFEETVRAKLKISKKEIKRRSIAMFELLRLDCPEQIYHCYPFELSGGMQQRVALSLAMILEPDLLLCDEPTSALDVKSEFELVKELERMRNELSVSILIITHNIALAKKLCDKIMVVYGGRMMEYRSKEALINAPQHPYTCKLLNAVPKLLEDNYSMNDDNIDDKKLYCDNCHLIHAGGEQWEQVSVSKE